MVATLVFTMVILGVYTALIQSYQMTRLSRCHDEARAILRSYVDQFQRLQTTYQATSTSPTNPRQLFAPTTSPVGNGLVWTNPSLPNTTALSDGVATSAATVANLAITLGTTSTPTPALITREVNYVVSTGTNQGGTTTTQTIEGAGYMMQAVFTATFTISGKTYTQSMTALRLAP